MLRKRSVPIILLGFMLVATAWGQSENVPPSNENDLWSQFKVIVERNIFSRQRGRNRRRPERSLEPERPRYVPSEESRIVLKGIARENGQCVAFFEDTRSSQILRIRTGQAIARGKIEALTLDHAIFHYRDQTRIVTVGQNLEGQYGSGGIELSDMMEWSQTTAASSTATESAGSTPEASSAEESDILKKLMERRRQQLGD